MILLCCFLALFGASAQDPQSVVEDYVKLHGPETFRQPAGYLQFPYLARAYLLICPSHKLICRCQRGRTTSCGTGIVVGNLYTYNFDFICIQRSVYGRGAAAVRISSVSCGVNEEFSQSHRRRRHGQRMLDTARAIAHRVSCEADFDSGRTKVTCLI